MSVEKEYVDEAKRTLLKKCKLDDGNLKKLFSVLNKFRGKAQDESDLVERFADRCYKNAKDSEASIKQARNFCETAFGDLDRLYRLGPQEAFDKRIQEVAVVLKGQGGPKRSQWEFEFGDYYIGRRLGVGGTSEVLLGYHRPTDTEVAVKVYKKKYAKDAAKEGNILKDLKHRNIIKVYDSFENCLWKKIVTTVMVMEFANQGELIEYLMYSGKFEKKLARWVFKEILAAVTYCHKQEPPVVHRDLKHDNCLFAEMENGEYVVKINDFGFSKPLEVGELMKSMIGTEQYAAPEILKAKPYDQRVDIFALGVMLFVALSGAQPFKRADRNDPWYSRVTKNKWKQFWELHMRNAGTYQYSADEQELLEGMLEYEPDKRWSLEQIAKHPWVTDPECYTMQQAREILHRRKEKVDRAKHKAMAGSATKLSQPAGKGDNRSVIDPSNIMPPADYHTNVPRPGLWFYTYEAPHVALEHISNVVRDFPFDGKTDLSETMEEEEKKDDSAASTDKFEMAAKPLGESLEGLSAAKKVLKGKYELNFSVVTNGMWTHGVVHIYRCPNTPKDKDTGKEKPIYIVFFQPTKGTPTMLFPQIYDGLMMGNPEAQYKSGANILMAEPRSTLAMMKDLEKERLDGLARAPDMSFDLEELEDEDCESKEVE